jgi:predicted transcriptional regulator
MNVQSKIKVLESLYNKAQTRAQLQESTKLSYVTICIACRKLKAKGLIEETKQKQAYKYRLSDAGISALKLTNYFKEE